MSRLLKGQVKKEDTYLFPDQITHFEEDFCLGIFQ